jgi:hypothetical protein
MNGVLVVTLVRLGLTGTAFIPPRIFMYLSLQQFILSNLVLVLRRPWLVLRPSRLVLRELRSSFRVSRDSFRNTLGSHFGPSAHSSAFGLVLRPSVLDSRSLAVALAFGFHPSAPRFSFFRP